MICCLYRLIKMKTVKNILPFLFVLLIYSCATTKKITIPTKNIRHNNYNRIILYLEISWKKNTHRFIGTRPKTAWICILKNTTLPLKTA